MIRHGHILAEVDILERCVQETCGMEISANSVILGERALSGYPARSLKFIAKIFRNDINCQRNNLFS